jgi:cyclase
VKRIIPLIAVDERGRAGGAPGPASQAEPRDPERLARRYAEQGATELAVDCRGGPAEVRPLVERLIAAARLPLIVQAPIDTSAEASALLEAGASAVTLQEAALRDPDSIATLSRAVGRERLAVRIVAQGEDAGWRVLERRGGPSTEWDALTWAAVIEAQGAGTVILESAGRGACGEPFDLALLERVTSSLHTPVIAAGEAETVEDVFDALMIGGADGVLVGEVLHSGRATIREIEDYLGERGG